jgi:hypothetical protein
MTSFIFVWEEGNTFTFGEEIDFDLFNEFLLVLFGMLFNESSGKYSIS